MYKGVGVHFAELSHFLKYSMKMKYFGLIETKLFYFHRYLKTVVREKGGGERTP